MINHRLTQPSNPELRAAVLADAQHRCQHCGRPCMKPGESWDAFCDRLQSTPADRDWARQTSELVVDDESGEWGYVEMPSRFTISARYTPDGLSGQPDSDPIALCGACLLKYQAEYENKRKAATRAAQRARLDRAIGQTTLFPSDRNTGSTTP